jgi:hypothetical protein
MGNSYNLHETGVVAMIDGGSQCRYNPLMESEVFVHPRQWELIMGNRPMDYELLEGLCLMLIEELEYAASLAKDYHPRFTFSKVEGLLRKWEG